MLISYNTDERGKFRLKSYYIHLIRNGETVGEEKKQYIGSTDVELSTNGIEKLKSLKEKFDYLDPCLVFSSPLKRCVQTVQSVLPDKKIVTIPELREYEFGEFEGKTPEELINDPRYSDFIKHGTAAPGGESQEDFSHRVCAAFGRIVRDIMKSGATQTAICTHGGVIMLLLAVYGLPRLNMLEWQCAPGEGYTIRITPAVWMRSGMVEVTNLYPVELPGSTEEEYDDENFPSNIWADIEETDEQTDQDKDE